MLKLYPSSKANKLYEDLRLMNHDTFCEVQKKINMLFILMKI